MTDPWLQQLAAWHNFYLLLGSAAATLTGLMFVVVSLGPQLIAAHTATDMRAFVTPAVVYFTTVLVVAALMTVPAVSAPLLGAAVWLGLRHPLGLASGAAAVLLLLVIGIRNAWDLVLLVA